MPKMDIIIQHQLSKGEALKRIKTLLGETKSRFADKFNSLNERWEDNECDFSFYAMGFSVSGKISVDSPEIKIQGKIPFAAIPFRGKIESAIKEQAEKLLA